MDVAASEFYGTDKTYDLNFKEEVCSLSCLQLYLLIELDDIYIKCELETRLRS